jgi:hypothetical protein
MKDKGREQKLYQLGVLHGLRYERERIIKLIEETYADPDFEELGSFVFSQDIIELIQKGQQ